MIADLDSLLSTHFLGNTLYHYAIALGMFFGTFFGLHLCLFILKNRLKAYARKTKAQTDSTLVRALHKIYPIEYAGIALYIALQTLNLNPLLSRVIFLAFLILMTYMTIDAISALLTLFLQRFTASENGQNNAPILMNLLSIVKALLWVFGIFVVLSNAGVNITSLITGLGIGGVAVALALQNILSDLFSSFAIYFDKPFLIGDVITVGDKTGVVERIGIKTTRIRALQGEEIVFANKLLTEAQIQNFKKMRERRVVFYVSVIYETPHDLLKSIPKLLEESIESLPQARFNRAHLSRFDSSALTFEIVYYVLSDNYMIYMDVQQEINFNILAAFSEKQITLAYPTQTVYLRQVFSSPSSSDLH
jgi:small-conductance mechanosensitive channel